MAYRSDTTQEHDCTVHDVSCAQALMRMVLVGSMAFLPFAPLGRAANAYADPTSNDGRASLLLLQLGEVTANPGGYLVIDHKQYPVSPSVIVTDDEGRPRDLKEFVPGTQVRFHLRNDKIDQLVMMLPR